MQQWEYRTASLMPVIGWKLKGWKLRAINEQDLPDWKNTEYSSIVGFCNQMGQQGWELVSAFNGAYNGLMLCFKRPYVNETF